MVMNRWLQLAQARVLRAGRPSIIALFLAVFAACSSDTGTTYTVITVDADDEIRAAAKQLHVRVESGGDTRLDKSIGDPTWPSQPFVVHPLGGDATRHFKLLAEALDGDDGVLGSLELTTGFVDAKTRYARIRITAGSCMKSRKNSELVSSAGAAEDAPVACDAPDEPAAGSGGDEAGGTGGEPGEPGDVSPDEYGGMSGSGGRGAAGKGGTSGGGAGKGGVSGGGAGKLGGAGKGGAGAAGGGDEPAGPSCGDGKRNGDEMCDIKISPGEPDACPTQCKPSGSCKSAKPVGVGCNAHCEETDIVEVGPMDGCCPPTGNAKSDGDCDPKCGNGVVEAAETCDPAGSCPTKASCVSADSCVPVVFSGDPDKCTSKCETQPKITACSSGDKCCPSGCSHDSDSDCEASCGDGHVDTSAGETCDPKSSTLCPSCDDDDDCTTDTSTGSASTCDVKCLDHVKKAAGASDSCCPPGANNNTDPDCKPDCGNGAREMGELCDADCPANDAACDDKDPCTVDRVSGAACQRQCTRTAVAASTASLDGCCPNGASAMTDSDCAAADTKNLVDGLLFQTHTPLSTEPHTEPIDIGRITDGDYKSRWISAAESNVVIGVDLKATYRITRIRIAWAGDTVKNFVLAAGTSELQSVAFYVGQTSGQMQDVEEYSTATKGFTVMTGQYLLIDCIDRWNDDYGNSIYEVEVYGLPVTSP